MYTGKGKIYVASMETGTLREFKYNSPVSKNSNWKEEFIQGTNYINLDPSLNLNSKDLMGVLDRRLLSMGYSSFLVIEDTASLRGKDRETFIEASLCYACKKISKLPKSAVKLFDSFYRTYFNQILNSNNPYTDSLESKFVSTFEARIEDDENDEYLLKVSDELDFWRYPDRNLTTFSSTPISKYNFYSKNVDNVLHPLVDLVNMVVDEKTLQSISLNRFVAIMLSSASMDVKENIELGLYDFFIGLTPMYDMSWRWFTYEADDPIKDKYEVAIIAVPKYGSGVGIRQNSFYSRLLSDLKSDNLNGLNVPLKTNESGKVVGVDLTNHLFSVNHSDCFVSYEDTVESLKQKDLQRIQSLKTFKE